jgi:hypothetical protein
MAWRVDRLGRGHPSCREHAVACECIGAGARTEAENESRAGAVHGDMLPKTLESNVHKNQLTARQSAHL